MTDWICKEVHTDNGGYFEPVTELIRCKDCKHNRDGICGWHYGTGYRWVVDDDDDFCSVGERKDEYVTLYHDDIHFKDEKSEKAFYEALAERKEE